MDFYEIQEDLIRKDQQDNLLLEKILARFKDLQGKYSQVKSELNQKHQEIMDLKNLNEKLQKELTDIKNNNQTSFQKSTNHHENTHQYHHTQSYFPIYSHSAPAFDPRMDLYAQNFSSQITKRRIINGFVGQLTQQLQLSEEILIKQRRMQEEIKRQLTMSKEELKQYKHKQKFIQNELNLLVFENDQLKKQLQYLKQDKKTVQNSIKNDFTSIKKRYNMFSSQIDSELLYMDEIYHQIQLQLSNS